MGLVQKPLYSPVSELRTKPTMTPALLIPVQAGPSVMVKVLNFPVHVFKT